MGVILEEPKYKVLDPSPSLKTTGECGENRGDRRRERPGRGRGDARTENADPPLLCDLFLVRSSSLPGKTVANFTAVDLLKASAFTGVAVALGYSTGEENFLCVSLSSGVRWRRGPSSAR